ncbi:hypothetical protein [Streptomyces litchfieldiae]|uniref:Uncharacterized protein n=1 Tax=Streptomyces litchfieldiae TaxID=3075543 RepID=A0ABU2MN26_9ACTN|nr:hypothetical protein [Streptomyces sp. DSM 44938]MDT0342955.1 hypothetical protein [Streptomyces sp. DSM 44938]
MNVIPDAGGGRAVPLRLDSERWATRRTERRVLVVVHTLVGGQRLLDVVRLLENDLRIEVTFTVAPDVFNHGVAEDLHRRGVVALPWRQAVDTRFDLALAASYDHVDELHAPVMLFSHGAGFNKFASSRPGARGAGPRDAYGLDRQRLVKDGVLVADTLVLAHEEERERLARQCPEALPTAVVVGDPVYDRVLASRPARALYRAALGARPEQKLVLFTSTWGPRSMFGQTPELLARAVAELPSDTYRVAMLLHPNSWAAHGEWQIQTWLAGLCRAGLALISQHADFCGAVVAADVVVGDHGSLALYGAVGGAPVLLSAFPESGVDPAAPMSGLASFAPRVDGSRPLPRQLERGAARLGPERYRRIAERLSSEPGRFAPHMRRLLYRKLRLRPRGTCPRTTAAPPPFTVATGPERWSAAS